MCGERRRRMRGPGWATRARRTGCSSLTTTGGGPAGGGPRSPGPRRSAGTCSPGGSGSPRPHGGTSPRCRRRSRAAFEAYASGVNAGDRGRGAAAARAVRGRAVASVALRRGVPGAARADGAVAAQAGQRGAARARRARAFARLETRPPLGSPLAVPPGGRLAPPVSRLLDDALGDVVGHLGFLAEVEPGSNAWAVSGRRTAHGGAVICNDSHRALDTPNVYWQCRVSCPDFDVAGRHVPRAAGVPALRLQRVGRVGDHPRGRRHAGPLPGAVLRRPVPDAVRLGAGRGAAASGSRCAAVRRSRCRRGRPGTGRSCTGRPDAGIALALKWTGHLPGRTAASSACSRC